MADGYFRTKKGYTVVQNGITRDLNVSLKAKGLYLVIQSYITLPDKKWRKAEFQNMTCEGKKAFESAWNELKEKGYLRVHMYSDGYTWTVEYELLDEAEPGPHTFYYNAKGELTRTNLERSSVTAKTTAEEQNDTPGNEALQVEPEETAKVERPVIEGSVAASESPVTAETNISRKDISVGLDDGDRGRTPQKGVNGSGGGKESRYPHFGSNGKGGNGYINTINKYSNTSTFNPSIHQSKDTGQIINRLKENLDYDLNMRTGPPGDREIFENIFNLICEIVSMSGGTVTVNGSPKPQSEVREKFLKLNSGHLQYVMETMKKQHSPIRNIRSYILTALYNAPDTIDLYYDHQVRQDMRGG